MISGGLGPPDHRSVSNAGLLCLVVHFAPVSNYDNSEIP